jgi:hypothetical protein
MGPTRLTYDCWGRFDPSAPSGERPPFAHSGRLRRKPAVADRDLGRLNWVDSAPTGTASGTTGVRAIAALPLRARNSLHRPKQN